MTASAYHVISKEVENHISRHHLIFRHKCLRINPYWQSSGIIIFLCKYYIVMSDTLLGSCMCFSIFALCNSIRTSWETENERLSYRKNYIEEFL